MQTQNNSNEQPTAAAVTALRERITAVRANIAAAAARVNRDPASVTLVAVTKTHTPQTVAAAVEAGVTHLGENRVQEATRKIEALDHLHPRVCWHLIGHLQRNKARTVANTFDLLHSLDSVRLADALHRQHPDNAPPLPVLLQVNLSGEESKEGFDLPGGTDNTTRLPVFAAAVEHILALPTIAVQGLMTIAPLSTTPETARPVFRQLRLLRDWLAGQFPAADWHHLSMGMTNDYPIAIEEGATIVRIGRALFGERPPPR
jgi:hypothetical protein